MLSELRVAPPGADLVLAGELDLHTLAQLQAALWAILSYSDRKFGAWDREEFFRTGEVEIEELMARAEELGRPVGRASALDFGCGVGRLTRALSAHFESCLGLDISETMVKGGGQTIIRIGTP